MGSKQDQLENFPRSLQQHADLLIHDLHLRLRDLRNALVSLADYGSSPQSQARPLVKRGLVNIVGEAAQALFGLVDSATFEEAQDAIDQLESLSEQERIQLNLHTEIINITQMHIKHLESFQSKAMAALTELDSNVNALSAAMLNQDRLYFHASQSIAMVSVISYSASAIADLTYAFDKFGKGIEGMLAGQLRPEIFGPKHLTGVINEL